MPVPEQTAVAPDIVAVGAGFMVIVAKLVSLIQGNEPTRVYVKVLVVVPNAGV